MNQNNQKVIVLLEPFFAGSHRQWAETWQKYSRHKIIILSLPGRHWKWRMHGGAVELATDFLALEEAIDFIVGTDMLDMSTFLALTKQKSAAIPSAIYFHENQLTYPWSESDPDVKLQRDNHYAFINFTSALSVDEVWFNSDYHLTTFLGSLPNFLSQFPDYNLMNTIPQLARKSRVRHLMMDLSRYEFARSQVYPVYQEPVILWNHRWEYDKNPSDFFKLMYQLKKEKISFKLIVLGERFSKVPVIFKEAKERLLEEIIHWGFAETFESYASLLMQSDILPVTSNQDFFGGSIVEAIHCDVLPILPNRLAYPEHVPKQNHSLFLYSNFEDLIEKTKLAIGRIDHHRSMTNRSWVKKYDVSFLIDQYDDLLFGQ